MVNITSLEKSVNLLANKLRNKGYTVTLEVFKTGPGGVHFYGPSYVELMVNGDNNLYETVKFTAGQFANDLNESSGEFGDSHYSEMKRKAVAYLQKAGFEI